MEFRWNNWNSDHVGRHGVLPEEAEAVVRRARRPYPQARADEKWLVRGQNSEGRWLQVVFVFFARRYGVRHTRKAVDRR